MPERGRGGSGGRSASGDVLAGLCRRSTGRAVATVLGEYLLIAAAIAAAEWVDTWAWYPLVVLFVGTRQYAIGECLVHEASHRNLSRSRRMNDLLGMISAWPFFFTLAGYRRFHNRLHHGVGLDDPDNSIREDYADWGLPPEDRPLGHWQAVWHLIAKPLLGLVGLRHLAKTLQDFYWDRDLVENAVMLAAWATVIALAAATGLLGGLAAYWIVPWLTVYAVLNYWSEIGDHYRVTGAETRSDLNWFMNTFVSHNIGYHALHHRYPGIPWFRLPAAHRLLRHELSEQVSTGYVATFRQIVAAGEAREEAEGGVLRAVPAGR